MKPVLAESLLCKMAEIRVFEQTLLDLFSKGRLYGTTHTCIGQEACAVALYSNLNSAIDVAFGNHRCHGHYLAFGGSMKSLFAELMGKESGVCEGRGGSQHICNGSFFSQGVQGQSFPIAVGVAYRKRILGEPGIVVVHMGDGTLGQGIVYESLNLASLLSVPVLVVMEHNGVAQSTDTKRTISGSVCGRFSAFGIETDRRKADDPVKLASHLAEVVKYVRAGKPFVQVIDTVRLAAHSKGDDDRPSEVMERAWEADWLSQQQSQGDWEAEDAFRQATAKVEGVLSELDSLPPAAMGSTDVFARPPEPWISSSAELAAKSDQSGLRISQILNGALDELLAADLSLQIVGEDLSDPYGGAFKVTRGLSTKYGDRVLSTPISEAAIVGLANGWALAGGTSVAEIMFGDFVTLAAEQLINQAAKMRFMYNGQVQLALTVRLVSGGYRGYGATHSQSLEKLFCGVPGLKTVALSRRHDASRLLWAAVRDPNPVVFVENKVLYTQKPASAPPLGFVFQPLESLEPGAYPPLFFRTSPANTQGVTVVTYGGLTDMVEAVLEQLILEQEMDFDYFVLSQLNGKCEPAIAASASSTHRILVVEEGTSSFGVGAELIAQIAESVPGLKAARVGAIPVPIPSARHLEQEVLPTAERIRKALLSLL